MSIYICTSSHKCMCVYMHTYITEKFTQLLGCGGNSGHVPQRFPSLLCPFWYMKVHPSCTGQEFQEEPEEGWQPGPTLIYTIIP